MTSIYTFFLITSPASPVHFVKKKKNRTNLLISSKTLPSEAYYQNQCFSNCTLETTSHHPSRLRKKYRKLFKSKNSTAQRNFSANKHPELKSETLYQTKPANFSITDRVFIIPNRLLPNWPCDGWMLCPGWGRENSRGFFHGFMGPYFMGISYSVVQVIFKAASHPLIPLSSPHLTIGWKRFS